MLLESKLDDFCKEVHAMWLEASTNRGVGLASTDAAINKVMSLFHVQLQESAPCSLDDSQMMMLGVGSTSNLSRISSNKAMPRHR